MGLTLLFLRFMVHESGMYSKMHQVDGIARGSLKLLFGSANRIGRYACCVLLGVPIYLCFGIFATFSPEIALAIGISEKVSIPDVMLYGSIGITAGDIFAGLLSQLIKRRKLPIAIFNVLGFIGTVMIVLGLPRTSHQYCLAVGFVGIFCGYWACLITATAEQFGTNLRATATTTVPNLVRASTIVLTTSFVWLKPIFGIQNSLMCLVLATYFLAFVSLRFLKESFDKDLDFYE